MPVLAEPDALVVRGTSTPLAFLLLAGAAMGLCSVVLGRRQARAVSSLPRREPAEPPPEKQPEILGVKGQDQSRHQLPSPKLTQNQTPGTVQASPPRPSPTGPLDQDLVASGANAYSADAYSLPAPFSGSPVSAPGRGGFPVRGPEPPRRRSYTQRTPRGTEVRGEVVLAEGWRRHTRVFGGGVCRCCEESERRETLA
ncbi:unnamed protein product [Diplocarpon coronariae]